MPGLKKSNAYADALGPLYARTPKAVFAAIAVSGVWRDETGNETNAILKEWITLHQTGILPQKPPGEKREKLPKGPKPKLLHRLGDYRLYVQVNGEADEFIVAGKDERKVFPRYAEAFEWAQGQKK